MTFAWVHPRFSSLKAFADLDLGESARLRVARHAQACPSCRTTIAQLRALTAQVRAAAMEAPAADLGRRIRARIAAGERVILPDATPAPVPVRDWRGLRVAAGAALVIAGVAAVFLAMPSAYAGASAGALRFLPEAPRARTRVEVRYTPSGPLAGARELRLRATSYPADNVAGLPPVELTPLARGRDGEFSGAFVMPDDIVLLSLEVAGPDGVVDDNDARRWELSRHAADGRTDFQALRLSYMLHQRTDWEHSFDIAQQMLREYPDRPESMRFVLIGATALAGPAARDSVVAHFRPRFDALTALLRRSPLDADGIATMVFLSDEMNDSAAARSWRERGVREFPLERSTVQQRVFMIFQQFRTPPERLAALDRLWDEGAAATPQLTFDAFNVAVRMGDAEAVARWGQRMLDGRLSSRGGIGAAWVGLPALRERGLALLREHLAALPPVPGGDWRLALKSVQQPTRSAQQYPLQALAMALRGSAPAAARDSLARAASLGWDPRAFRQLGDVTLEQGDTSAAAAAYAWLSVDVRTSAATTDSLRRAVASAGEALWRREQDDARSVQRRLILAGAIRRELRGDAQVVDRAGNRLAVSQLAAPGIWVVAAISRSCPPSLEDMAALQRVAAELGRGGVPLVAVIEESPNDAALADIARRGFTSRVLFDDRAELSRALRQVGTPEYFVIERGEVRFEARRAEELPPLARVLQDGRPAGAR